MVRKIKERLPRLFQIAELESQRAGKVGMQVGSLREKIIIALLIYKFGIANVDTNIPITEPETDVRLFGHPVSIKTISKTLGGVKLSWTVDEQKAFEFAFNYHPRCDMLLVLIRWDDIGALYYIPIEAQLSLFKEIGLKQYIKLPKPGTNPRGVEIAKEALLSLVKAEDTRMIEILWKKLEIDYDPYKRWVDYWKEGE